MTDVSMLPDYFYVNKSILKLNICVRLSVSVLLHYNFKVNVRCIPQAEIGGLRIYIEEGEFVLNYE